MPKQKEKSDTAGANEEKKKQSILYPPVNEKDSDMMQLMKELSEIVTSIQQPVIDLIKDKTQAAFDKGVGLVHGGVKAGANLVKEGIKDGVNDLYQDAQDLWDDLNDYLKKIKSYGQSDVTTDKTDSLEDQQNNATSNVKSVKKGDSKDIEEQTNDAVDPDGSMEDDQLSPESEDADLGAQQSPTPSPDNSPVELNEMSDTASGNTSAPGDDISQDSTQQMADANSAANESVADEAIEVVAENPELLLV